MRVGRAWYWYTVLVASSCALVLLAQAPQISEAQEQTRPPEGADYAADELLVTFEKEDVSRRTVNTVRDAVEGAEDTQATVEPVSEKLGIRLFEFPTATDGGELASVRSELARDPRVVAAEYNYKLESFAPPDDRLYPQQYYLPKIRAAEAYGVEQGSEATRIGVVDSGIQQPPAGTTDHVDLDAKVVAQRDFVGPGPADPVAEDLDSVSHGTAVAGVASAETNNASGIAGVCPDCSIIVSKFYTSDTGTAADAIQGIQHSVSNEADVINMSFGTESDIQALERAVNAAYDKGVTLVAAAGNAAQEGNPTVYPAAYRRVIAVAATNKNDGRAYFSSFGNYVDVTAPGVGILTTKAQPPNTYGRIDGTSFSAPIVAGVAGLLADRDLGNAQIKRRLECTAKDLGPKGKDPKFGAGLVNSRAALSQGCAPPPPPKCNDGKDNDRDGRVDRKDPGCSSRNDDTERSKNRSDRDRVRCTIRGTDGDNVLEGTPRGDKICGRGGDDVIRGLSGKDRLVGGAGRDQLLGSFGNDTLDSKDGQRGNDVLDGGQGNDRFIRDRRDTLVE